MRYTTEQHTREGWTQFKADLDAGQTREISEEIAHYLGARRANPSYLDLDGTRVRVTRDAEGRYYICKTR